MPLFLSASPPVPNPGIAVVTWLVCAPGHHCSVSLSAALALNTSVFLLAFGQGSPRRAYHDPLGLTGSVGGENDP